MTSSKKKGSVRPHLAELLLDLKYRGPADRFRSRRPFSEDIASAHGVLFSPRYDRRRKVRTYRQWLETNQPCVFGRVAARNKSVFICLLEEQEILTMRRGDDDVRDTIQDYRQVWKRHALEGLCSSLVIVLVSRALVDKEPGPALKEVCRRLLELYMEVEPIEDDTILSEREYLFLRGAKNDGTTRLLKFSTLPNIFCAQADGRWWHDHRTPGGVMITSNALGHFAYARTRVAELQIKHKVQALENAMRTINNAYPGPETRAKIRHCPATQLVPRPDGEVTPLRETSDFHKYSPDHYQGYFHTDHLIPSVFFSKERDPKKLKLYPNLGLRYIFDPEEDPADHAELMAGREASWYEVRRNTDRIPDFANPERVTDLSTQLRARLAAWLEKRLKERLER